MAVCDCWALVPDLPTIPVTCGANPHKGEKIMPQKTSRKAKKPLSKGKKLPSIKPLRSAKGGYLTVTLDTVIVSGY